MLFNSYIFILLFLPFCFLGYFIINKFGKYDLAQLLLLGVSLWFYGYFNVKYLVVIICSILFNYCICLILYKKKRKVVLLTGILVNISVLIYFKYMDFFISNINRVFNREYELWGIVLPLGISFFTFQQISFITDVYKEEVPKYSLLYYASYVAYFPQLIAGPIVTHDELIPQFMDKNKRVIDWDNLSKGIYIFALGLSKKVLLADTFGNAVNWCYANIELLDTTNAILAVVGYTIQIYFDFSGYCDMAVGIGKMMNIDLPLNFNSPYKALTIVEFWDRWHMTLTRFFTKYVYIPLGGNRKGIIRTYINIFTVFCASGFWHGASWTFILWGGCHGVFSIITRVFKGTFEKLHPALNWMITFGFTNIMWVFFRADSFHDAIQILKKIVALNFGGINNELLQYFRLIEVTDFLMNTTIEAECTNFMLAVFYLMAIFIILGNKNSYEKMQEFKPTILNVITTAFLMVWCIFSFSGISTFLYFNF